MDQSIRNELRNVVTKCRKLLEEAVSQVLQGQFGIYASAKKDEVHVEEESRMKNLSEEDRCTVRYCPEEVRTQNSCACGCRDGLLGGTPVSKS